MSVFGAAGGLVGGILGSKQAGAGEGAGNAAREAALRAIQNVYMPTVEEQELALQQLQLQGELTPEMQAAIAQGPSEMAGVETDPRLAAVQMQALEGLAGMSEGGLTEADEAMMRQAARQGSQQSRAEQEAILQNMAQRGVAGGGLELAARQSASQSAMNRAAEQADQIAIARAQAKQNALSNMGQFSTQMRGQQFGEGSAKAQAADAISQFNVANQRNVQGSNVGARNRAQEANLREKSRVADTNVGLSNQEQMHNKALIQQKYQNEMQKAKAAAEQQNIVGAGKQAAGYAKAGRTAGMWGSGGQMLDAGAKAAGGMG